MEKGMTPYTTANSTNMVDRACLYGYARLSDSFQAIDHCGYGAISGKDAIKCEDEVSWNINSLCSIGAFSHRFVF